MGRAADAMTEIPRRARSLAAIHAAVLLFGFPGLFARWLPLPSLLLVLGRVVLAALALGVALRAAGVPLRMAPARDLGLGAVCGLVLAVHWAAFFEAVRVSSVAVGLLSYATFPAFTVVLEAARTRSKPDRANLVFAGFTLLGVYLVVPRFALAEPVLRGVLWGLLSGATFAVLAVLNRSLTVRQPSLRIAFWQDLFAALWLAPSLLVLGAPRLSVRDILLLVLLGVVCTALAHSLFIRGLRGVSAQIASLIASLEPVYGILFALVLLGEVPGPRTLLGGAVILSAVIAVTARASRRSAV